MKNIIKGNNIIKSFNKKENINVLDNIDITIKQNDFVAIMGPSGCGKTTLLFALSGTDNIDSGKIYFNESELSKLKEKNLAEIRRNKMGFVFQQPTMLKNLNILDNIILSQTIDNKSDKSKIITKAKELMKKTGIEDLENRNITEVSGGQLQRAGICRALINNPDIIFADEPTGALNSKTAEEIMDLFCDINKNGTALFLVTHDAKIAARAKQVLFMKDGKIKSELFLNDFKYQKRSQIILEKMSEVGI